MTLSIVLMAFFWLASSSLAQEIPPNKAPPIRVAGPISRPHAFVNSRGEPAGFSVDVLRALGERLGRGVEVTLTANMQDALDLVAAGEADVLYGAVATPERRAVLAFTRPFETTNVVFYVLRDRAGAFTGGDFSGMVIGVRKGGLAESSVEQTLGEAPVLYDTLEEMMVAINTGEIDLVAAPKVQWDQSIRILRMEDQYVRVGEPLLEGDVAIGVDRRQPELLTALDGALYDFMAEAEFGALRDKWFGLQDYWKISKPSTTESATIAMSLALLVGAGFWGRARLRAVQNRETLRREELAQAYASELNRANAILKHSHDEMERLLYAVTHDLKSPIVTVRGFAGVLEEAAKEDDFPAMHRASKRILAGTERLDLITDALLTFGSFGRSDTLKTDIDLTQILADVRTMLEKEFAAAGATLEIRRPLATLYADETQVLRLMLNLVGNALRYGCPRPGMKIEVSTEVGRDGAIVTVRDRGPGVPEALRREVFRLFRRHGPEEPGSTGMGLAIVEKIAQKHGGACWIEDAPGGGAAFRASFPGDSATAIPLVEARRSA